MNTRHVATAVVGELIARVRALVRRAAEKIAAALTRGGRLDEAGPGHGPGLAIANDLVDATRGQMTLVRSELGGLKVSISWAAER